MELIITGTGVIRCLYGEEIPLASLGRLAIRRASTVEPDAEGDWQAGLAPVGGPILGPFRRRSEALAAEMQWLNTHLMPGYGGREHAA